MTTLILHHYPMSPFSEKIRAMLGYADLSWQSCTTREMPPRPLLAHFSRRLSVKFLWRKSVRIFSVILILLPAEIAQLSNKPQLAIENLDAEQQAHITKVDLDLFPLPICRRHNEAKRKSA